MKPSHRQRLLPIAIAALLVSSSVALAQEAQNQNPSASAATPPQKQTRQRSSVSTTSNTTTLNASKLQQMATIEVRGRDLSLGGGLMSPQEAPKAVSTITRDAIVKAAPGANYAQMIQSIPGVTAITDDYTGLNDGDYSIRGFTNDEVGVTVNGAPINDSGNYRVYPTEYGDTENMGDITVLQGYPDVDQPVAGAAGGTIAWATIQPSHHAGVDLSLSGGSHSYQREFIRVNTGDTGPIRSWISYSNNQVNLWRGEGDAKVTKIDGKSVWTINDDDSITASLQYNREIKYGYDGLTRDQAAQNYYQSYNTTLTGDPSVDKYYWALHTNPFRSWLFSLDGEFMLNDNLSLSIVPYFQYGGGGGGGGTPFYENTSPGYYGYYGVTDRDIDGDGAICGGSAGPKYPNASVSSYKDCTLAYDLSRSYTWRPGVIAKFNQYLGENDSLEYGVWFDEPRQEQRETFAPTYNGVPIDVWMKTNQYLIPYSPDGNPQYLYNEYTASDLRRIFVTNTWTPNEKWTVTLGAAYTWERRKGWDYEYYGATAGPDYKQQFGGTADNSWHKITPTAGVKYQINDRNQIYFGYGRTFRAPINGSLLQNAAVLYYYGLNPGEASYSGITSEQLAAIAHDKPETAETVDLGWRYYAGRISASVDAYASNLTNKQVSGYDEASGETVYLTVPELHQRGLNAEASFKLNHDFTLYASYAYTRSIIEDNTATIGDGTYPTAGKNFVDVPKNTAYVRLNFDHGPFWANLDWKARGAMWADWMNTQKTGGFATLNFNAGYRFQDFSSWLTRPEIKLNVYNLTDRHALTWDSATTILATKGPVDPNTGDSLYVQGAYYSLLEPRTFMLTLSASFF
jgi:iron complex outermembrane recepter protein